MTDQANPASPNEPQPKVSTRWGQDRRLAFIDYRLQWDGRINRSNLTDFFNISIPQASLDLARYMDMAPGNLVYDRSSRTYLVTPEFRPLVTSTHSQRYLDDLGALAAGRLEPESAFVGWRPPTASVPLVGRVVPATILASLISAMRDVSGIRVLYQSMSSPEPTSRVITPHALAHDGFRWHVRAYCHSRSRFLDFVLGRILAIQDHEKAGPTVSDDHEWNTILGLVLAANPALPDAQQRAIELDYGMVDGEIRLECRQALLFYTIKRYGLQHWGTEPAPLSQHVVLKNNQEILPLVASAAVQR
ncbi:WYL domain-containing protein [Caballeronia sp. LZ001]|uniref:WYL domain-containing protein n=1 Tax=Caballeronia sp. LZ001 TaxID=3038553 RepID=UPI00285CD98A|nr:WYL domain-containing protein [Caballeronia sp. LZ001]MDR5804969.1 WYL domain-containing protein [Caballeronia sp. LZ001]